MRDNQRVAHSVFSALRWSATARLLTQLVTWTSTIVVARLLVPADYGLVALASVVVGYFMMLSDFGLGAALIRNQSASREEASKVDTLLLSSGVAIALAIFTSAPLIASLMGDPRISPMVRVVAVLPFISASLAVPNALLTRDMRFDVLAKTSMLSGATAALVTVACAYAGLGAWALVTGWISENVLRAIILRYRCRLLTLSRPNCNTVRPYLAFSKWIIGEKTLWYWYAEADTALVGRLLGATPLGFFTMAKQLAMTPSDKIVAPLNQIALPAFSAIQADPRRVTQMLGKVMRLGASFALPTLLGLSAVAPELVQVLLGNKWRDAGLILSILCLAVPFRVVTALMTPALTAVGRPDVSFKNMVMAIIVVPCALVAGTFWGPVGVATAWSLSVPFVAILFIQRASRILGTTAMSMLSGAKTPTIASVTMAPIVFATKEPLSNFLGYIAGLGASVAIGVLLYLIIVLVIDRRLMLEYRDFVRSLMRGST